MKTCCDDNWKGAIPEGLEKHPCFNGDAHNTYGRIHLPVSPACNIQCRYCKRGFNKWEASPGVARGLLTPEAAARTVDRALKVCPEITVVGIAGPGEPLATGHALDTLRLVHEKHPELIMCLSTNGLALNIKAPEILESGVRSVTVTVNAVNSLIQKAICSHIRLGDMFYTGEEASRRLITAQLSGIRSVTSLGLFVKVNTVLIPGINDRHIGEIASVTAKAGASMINIIPLLPRFELSARRQPTAAEIASAQAEAGKTLPVFTHCVRCRADACGIPGSGIDFGNELLGRVEPTFSHG